MVTEEDRIAMALRQPQSMQNYTEVGFKKIKAPEALFSMIRDFWDSNHMKGKPEVWGSGNTYTNNWEFPSEMISVEDSGLRGGGNRLKQNIWDAAREVTITICALEWACLRYGDVLLTFESFLFIVDY